LVSAHQRLLVAHSYLIRLVPAPFILTGVLVLGFGISFLFFPKDLSLATATAQNPEGRRPSDWIVRMVSVAMAVGFVSGLLANAGGFLLVPC